MSARVPSLTPARCETTHVANRDSPPAVDLRGDPAVQGGRFPVQGRAPSRVWYGIGGRLRDGAITSRARLTFLDLDYVGADDSFQCDTGTRRYRARR